ncbi:MAG: hypothetical protein ACTSSK_11845, partial [Candidatus Heimdallarchaeota archaeon]
MFRRKSTLIGLFAVVLSLSSLFFLPISIGVGEIENPVMDTLGVGEDLVNEQGLDEPISSGTTFSAQDVTTNTTGSYKVQAYFTQDTFVNLEGLEYNFEWEKYEDVKDDALSFIPVDFIRRNDTIQPNFKLQKDTWQEMWSSLQITEANNRRVWSVIYSPEFTVDTYIKDSVIFMMGGEIYYSQQTVFDVRVRLERFNPSTNTSVALATTSGDFTDSDDNPYNSTSGNYYGEVYETTLANKTLIPAGYRLKATIECRVDSSTLRPSDTGARCQIRSGQVPSMYNTEWNVDSSNDTFDNYYVLENDLESIGMQLYYYQENYPTIELTGLANNTIYTSPTNGTITISSNSILNQYKWDSDSFTSFNSPKIVSLPETTGWHTLTVQASDYFDSMAEATYIIGYDAISSEVVLHSPANNSRISGGEILNFGIYESTSVTYEWDKNSTQYPLLDPFNITSPSSFIGSHQLTIHYTDPFDTILYEYFFIFDNAPPEVLLVNVLNETTQPQGKNIDIIIDDISVPLDVQYKWDSDSYATWAPFLGNLYREYLPATAGWHNLSVFANDSYGNSITKVFSFNTSLTLLNVDLYNLVNSSYYQGGNTVEVAITNDNATIKFFWGNDPWSDGTIYLSDGIMTLSGANALSSTPGTYILTVIVGNADDEQVEFKFLFIVDQENPTIVQTYPVPDYNGTRFLDSEIFYFTIDDNWTTTEDLEIYYSIDGQDNQTLLDPYQIYLSGLSDGLHN